jgi:hypothetical protein
MQVSQIYFGLELYIFRTDLLYVIRSFITVYKNTLDQPCVWFPLLQNNKLE